MLTVRERVCEQILKTDVVGLEKRLNKVQRRATRIDARTRCALTGAPLVAKKKKREGKKREGKMRGKRTQKKALYWSSSRPHTLIA